MMFFLFKYDYILTSLDSGNQNQPCQSPALSYIIWFGLIVQGFFQDQPR